MNRPRCVVFDMDNTLANNMHRVHFVTNGNKEWDKFYENSLEDKEILPTVMIARQFFDNPNIEVVICTGRHIKNQKITHQWLIDHLIYYNELHMRPNNDSRKDFECKADLADIILDKYDVIAVFEDKPLVCQMWRDKGCFVFEVKGDVDE